jgi:hypothetical protein
LPASTEPWSTEIFCDADRLSTHFTLQDPCPSRGENRHHQPAQERKAFMWQQNTAGGHLQKAAPSIEQWLLYGVHGAQTIHHRGAGTQQTKPTWIIITLDIVHCTPQRGIHQCEYSVRSTALGIPPPRAQRKSLLFLTSDVDGGVGGHFTLRYDLFPTS